MKFLPKITFCTIALCIMGILLLNYGSAFSQQTDSTKISFKSKAKKSKTPEIKGTVPTYKPSYLTSGFTLPSNTSFLGKKQDKSLMILKVYPNPIESQFNLTFRLNQDANFIVKIIDLLGNEIVTLTNERVAAGEYTKTYNIPSRLNPGIYFLRTVAGSESVVKRISIL